MFLREDLGGVDRRVIEPVAPEQPPNGSPGLLPLEHHGDLLALDHLGPRGLEGKDLAGFEFHEPVRGALDIGHAVRDVGDPPRAFERLVRDEVVERLGEDVFRLRAAQEIECQIDHVQQVDQRPAAGERFGSEPSAEAWDAGSADPFRLRRVDLSDRAIADIIHDRLAVRPGPVVEIEHEGFAGLLRCRLHFADLGRIQRGRFFAEDMLARLEGLDCQRLVEFVREDHAHGVDVRVPGKHFGGIFVGTLDAVSRRGFFRSSQIHVRNRNHLGTRRQKSGNMILDHSSRPDNSNLRAHARFVADRHHAAR